VYAWEQYFHKADEWSYLGKRRENYIKWSAAGLGAGAILGAVIGVGEKWTEERIVGGIVPLDGGGMLMVSMNWK
jgi:hypothetical protein